MSTKKPMAFAKNKIKKEYDGLWKILIVDDEENVHTITKTVLNGIVFENKELKILSAYSAYEAKEILKDNSDIAMILLDVVMEEDDSGLMYVKYVRNELKNQNVRIVLRTGQPGQAPERQVIEEYDINDYKSKTELTANKLYTSVISSLRNYRDLIEIEDKSRLIEQNRQSLEQVIISSANIFGIHIFNDFAKSILDQLISILALNCGLECKNINGFTVHKNNDELVLLSGTPEYIKYINQDINHALETSIISQINETLNSKKSQFIENNYIAYFETHSGHINLMYISGHNNLTHDEKKIIEIFSSNVSIAYENIYLNKDIEDTQIEVINTLGEVVETRSEEAANHVKRVSQYAYLLAREYGLDENEAQLIKLAAPMHDVGKIGIPDYILLKADKLNEEEFDIMKTHATIGHNILKGSNKHIMKAAAIIAHEHHERFDGTGYPQQLSGNDIHLYGRIVAVADVFDALTHKRVYKESWSMDETIAYFKEKKGTEFDPDFTDILLNNIHKFEDIIHKY